MKKFIILMLTALLAFTGMACTKTVPPQQNSETKPDTQPETKPETEAPKAFTPDPNKKYPLVTIEMENGKVMKVELYPEVAPNTVNNFISLVKKGFYNGLIFHRVIPGFMIQGGDPDGNGTGGPGYGIKGEFSSVGVNNNLLHERGVISMARSNHPDSAGSQFFITVDKADYLDGQYAAFGKVIEGMETADGIVSVDRDANDKPFQDQKMKKVTVDTFGQDYPEPEKNQNR